MILFLALLACTAADDAEPDGDDLLVHYGEDGGDAGGDDAGGDDAGGDDAGGGDGEATPDRDADGYDEDEDCDDNDPNINPGAPDTDCDQIDEDCDGEPDDDFDGDGGEPDDDDPRELGTLDDDEYEDVSGYFFPAHDKDRVRFYTVDDWNDWFGFEINLMDVPSDVDAWIELWIIEDVDGEYVGLVETIDEAGPGGDETLSYGGGWSDNTATYEIVIQSGADASCEWPYLMQLVL